RHHSLRGEECGDPASRRSCRRPGANASKKPGAGTADRFGLYAAGGTRYSVLGMDYRVALPEFHGPLDLLLYLVKKNEVDVRDIRIAQIAEQFRDHLAVLHVADVELAGDFLVLAATLMEIKSKMLLPRAADAPEAEADDPRRELVRQLVEYKKFKEAAA